MHRSFEKARSITQLWSTGTSYIQYKKADSIGHILRRNCFLKHFTGEQIGGIEVTDRRGRRRKQLLNNLREMRGY